MTAADRDFVRRSRRLTRSHHLWDDPIVDHPLQRCEVGTATAAEATHPGPVQLAAMLADDLDPGTPVRAAEDAEDHAWNARRRAPSATEARPKATPAALGLAPHERDPRTRCAEVRKASNREVPDRRPVKTPHAQSGSSGCSCRGMISSASAYLGEPRSPRTAASRRAGSPRRA